jgi:hypothetical protein
MKHQHKAVLIAGSENHFVESIASMDIFLQSLGVQTFVHHFARTSDVLSSIKTASRSLSEQDVLLIVIAAHGSKTGIESPNYFNNLSYRKIIRALPESPKRVQFVTATCYGHFLIKELIGVRSGLCTGVITTWEGFRTTYDDTVLDVVDAWSNCILPEKRISKQMFSGCDAPYDVDFLGFQRWGGIHDQFFFSAA